MTHGMINTCPVYGACRVTITSGSPTEICGLYGLTKHKGLRPKHGGAQYQELKDVEGY